MIGGGGIIYYRELYIARPYDTSCVLVCYTYLLGYGTCFILNLL